MFLNQTRIFLLQNQRIFLESHFSRICFLKTFVFQIELTDHDEHDERDDHDEHDDHDDHDDHDEHDDDGHDRRVW